jgi:hypothetical protein
MKSYYLPREYKGEGRILYIFNWKSLIYTTVGAGIGYLFNFILSYIGIKKAFLPCLIGFGLIGYIIGTMRIPESNNFELTRKVGGEKLDEIIKRWFLFKMKSGKIYIYKEKTYEDVENKKAKEKEDIADEQ